MDLTTHYLGLVLPTPLLVLASPHTDGLDQLRAFEEAGAGAVVLPTLSVEASAAAELRHARLTGAGALSSPEAASYFPVGVAEADGTGFDGQAASLVRRARAALRIPVIARLHASDLAHWTEGARQLAAAGASALELDLHQLPDDNPTLSGEAVEWQQVAVVRAVRAAVTLPLAVRIATCSCSPGYHARQLVEAGADGLVLSGDGQPPDIDLVRLCFVRQAEAGGVASLCRSLYWLGLLHGRLPASLAAAPGVRVADEVVKCLLAGADGVILAPPRSGPGSASLADLVPALQAWLGARALDGLPAMRGLLSAFRTDAAARWPRTHARQALQGYPSAPA